MPNCDSVILRHWNECGCAMVGNSGVSPLTFTEIESYKSVTGLKLTSFAASAIKLMSDAYCVWVAKGREIACVAPYFEDTRTQEQKNKEVANKIRAMAKNRRKP